MTRLILTLACLAAFSGVPASAAPASPQTSSVRSAAAQTALASRDEAAVDPNWAPVAPIVLAPAQREPAPSNGQNHPAPGVRTIRLPIGGHASEAVHANGRHAGWAVAIRGYRATGPPIDAITSPASTPRARLA
ncbi:MAG: hypothetical protein ABI311_12840 [Gemmatimonadaceae bacterium]